MTSGSLSSFKKYLLGFLGICISCIALYLINEKIDFNTALKYVYEINFLNIIGLICIYLSSFFLRAYRWRLMFLNKYIPYSTFLSCTVIGFAGNNFLPVRGGELLRMEFYFKFNNLKKNICQKICIMA